MCSHLLIYPLNSNNNWCPLHAGTVLFRSNDRVGQRDNISLSLRPLSIEQLNNVNPKQLEGLLGFCLCHNNSPYLQCLQQQNILTYRSICLTPSPSLTRNDCTLSDSSREKEVSSVLWMFSRISRLWNWGPHFLTSYHRGPFPQWPTALLVWYLLHLPSKPTAMGQSTLTSASLVFLLTCPLREDYTFKDLND